MNKTENEIWKPIPKAWFIEISSHGVVRTLNRVTQTKKGSRTVKGKILKQHCNENGYLYVSFRVNGKSISKRVHRLVAEAFLPNSDNLPEINHKDNSPLNNDVSNLEWCTHKYNMQYREKYGVSNTEAQGHPLFAVNLKMPEVLCFRSQGEAGRKLGVNQGHINSVLKFKRKTAGGYWFTNDDSNAIEAVRRKFGDSTANKVKELMKYKKL